MKIQRALLVLTPINLILLIAVIVQIRPGSAVDELAPVLKGRVRCRLVDDRGRIRASINVYPAVSRENDSDASGDTVLLRLITDRSRPSVKFAASEQQVVLALVGPSGTKETDVQPGQRVRSARSS